MTDTSWWLDPSSLLAVHLYTPKSSLCCRLSLRLCLFPSWLESPVTRGSPSLVQMTWTHHMSHNVSSDMMMVTYLGPGTGVHHTLQSLLPAQT